MTSDFRRCGCCGAPCPAAFRAPPAELAPDLDGRPGEPARSTLDRWIAVCRQCGAAAPDLAAVPSTAAAIVESAPYRDEPDRFLRWAMLAPDPAGAAEAVLAAAWGREDRGEDGSALRLRAAAGWGGDALRRVDILRRAGALAEAASLAESLAERLAGLDEDGQRIVAFQQARIRAGDTGRQLLSSALRPPARTPHVTHVQKRGAGSGLLGRLFGR